MISAKRMLTTLLVVCLGAPLLGGCSKTPATAPRPNPTPNVNSDKPTGNARIQAQSAFGDPAKRSIIADMTVADWTSCYFRGWQDDRSGVGRVGSSGALQWFTSLPFTLREVLTLPPSASVPGGLVVVGKHDNDNDGESEIGYAWLFTAAGSLASTVLFSSDTSDVWVNAVAAVSDTVFVVVGGERTPARASPFVGILTLTAGGQLAKGPQVVLRDLDMSVFTWVALSPVSPSDGEVRAYAIGDVATGGNHAITVHALAASLPAMTTWSLAWSREIPGAGPSRWANDIAVYEDRIYVVGGTQDAGKEPRPAGGGYWDSGLAARLTPAGDLEWSSAIRATSRSDGVHAIVPTAGGIFLVGNASSYLLSESRDLFGYGWIAKITPATGVVTTSHTFGQDAYASGFNAGAYYGNTMYCGGWTNQETDAGPYRAWFCGIDVTNMAASSTPVQAGSTAVSGRIGNLPTPGDRTR